MSLSDVTKTLKAFSGNEADILMCVLHNDLTHVNFIYSSENIKDHQMDFSIYATVYWVSSVAQTRQYIEKTFLPL